MGDNNQVIIPPVLRKKILGYTLIEMLVVVAIVIILTALGVVNMNSRARVADLEEAAKTLSADVNFARGAAMFRGCPTRIIICMDKDCSNTSVSSISGNYIGNGSSAARYYAILRLSTTNSLGSCYNSSKVSGTGFSSNWDFEKRPQAIPKGIAFTGIYAGAGNVPDAGNWLSTTDAMATNSIWFSSSTGAANIPVSGNTLTNGDTIAFQLTFDSCDPSGASAGECAGYFVTVGTGGVVNMLKCARGTGHRTQGVFSSDNCF